MWTGIATDLEESPQVGAPWHVLCRAL